MPIRWLDEKGTTRLRPRRVLDGVFRRLRWGFLTLRFYLTNLYSRKPLCDPSSGFNVTIASFGKRLDSVYLTIESVARGSRPPREFYLVCPKDHPLPRSVRRLVRRGLILIADDPEIGPHNKYYPVIMRNEKQPYPLITFDDDVLADHNWARDLFAAYSATGGTTIVANWARIIRLDWDNHSIASSRTWPACSFDSVSPFVAVSGVWGVIYPPSFLQHLRNQRENFLRCAPKADDVWLNRMALVTNTPARQRLDHQSYYVPRFLAQRGGVSDGNVFENGNPTHHGNDIQVARTYSPEDVDTLFSRAELYDHI